MKIVHTRKCHPTPLRDILAGKKRHEIRTIDKALPPFKEGDLLLLKEWDPETKEYTGVEVGCQITYVSDAENLKPFGFGFAPDVVVLSIEWQYAVSGPARFKQPAWAPVSGQDAGCSGCGAAPAETCKPTCGEGLHARA